MVESVVKAVLIAVGIAILVACIAAALAAAATMRELGVGALIQFTSPMANDLGEPFPLQPYLMAGRMVGAVFPGLWTALRLFGTLVGAMVLWEIITALFHKAAAVG